MAYNPQNPNGSAASANSAPVVIASDQAAVPVTDNGGSLTVDGTVTANISGSISNTAFSVNNGSGASAVNIQDGGNSITVDGSVSVSNFPATQPVSGTIAATQNGTWNITNVSGTVSLPTGASTAAKQPALGTAGTASADVISVQGISGMTALKVDGSGVTQPVSLSTSTTGGMLTKSGSWQGGNTNTEIKATPGQVYGWYFYNPNTTAVYVKLYNVSGVNPSSSNYICTLPIPPVSGANAFGLGIVFDTAIYMTMGSTITGTGQPSQFVDYTIFYK